MNKTILTTLLVGLIGLSSFNKAPLNYEQIAFDYFVSHILSTDFKNLSAIQFKGQTETSFSTLGNYKFCLKPEEKLQSLIKNVANGPSLASRSINSNEAKNVTIIKFEANSNVAKLFICHSVRVADNFYVFCQYRSQMNGFINMLLNLT
jgi:hypothetical protein